LRLSRLSLPLVATVFLTTAAAFGSGFSIFEQGAKATAMGGAFAATADDPSAIYYNVAGIAQQRSAAFLIGGTAITFGNEFRGDPNDAFSSGSTGFYREHTFVPPNAYLVLPFGSNLTFGVGVFTPYGLRTSWADPWVGRFVSRDANVKTLSVEPALAWQTSDGRLAIGGGAEYRRAHLILNRNIGSVNPFNQRFADVANAYLASGWETHWGWNVGVLFKPSNALHIGAAYRTDMTINFKGNATITQIPTGNPQLDAIVATQLPPSQPITTSLPFPSVAVVGVSTGAIRNWDIEADLTHTTWSRFKSLDVVFTQTPSRNISAAQNWKDTWSYRLGGNHPVTPRWDVRLGAVYDKNPQPTAAVSPLLPDADRSGISFGVGYHQGPWVVDITEFALHFNRRSATGQTGPLALNGQYTTDANLVSLNLGYKF
jgi:long-chain fatty acid transport protein